MAKKIVVVKVMGGDGGGALMYRGILLLFVLNKVEMIRRLDRVNSLSWLLGNSFHPR